MIRIPIHSVTDLITNSSTTIYTYSDRSADACIAMLDEILKVLGSDKKCTDMFRVEVVPEDYDAMYDWMVDDERQPPECPDNFEEFEKLAKGADKPAWLRNLEKKFLKSSSDDRPANVLELTPLKTEYAPMGELITKFLYSTSHEASYNG